MSHFLPETFSSAVLRQPVCLSSCLSRSAKSAPAGSAHLRCSDWFTQLVYFSVFVLFCFAHIFLVSCFCIASLFPAHLMVKYVFMPCRVLFFATQSSLRTLFRIVFMFVDLHLFYTCSCFCLWPRYSTLVCKELSQQMFEYIGISE